MGSGHEALERICQLGQYRIRAADRVTVNLIDFAGRNREVLYVLLGHLPFSSLLIAWNWFALADPHVAIHISARNCDLRRWSAITGR